MYVYAIYVYLHYDWTIEHLLSYFAVVYIARVQVYIARVQVYMCNYIHLVRSTLPNPSWRMISNLKV